MTREFEIGKQANKPEIDREYIEIYPVNWTSVDQKRVQEIFTSRSHEDAHEMSLYFHIPFCPVLCPFCKFNIIEYNNEMYKEYISAVRTELSSYKDHPDIKNRRVTAVYFGGGTGSMIKPSDLAVIMGDINHVFPVDKSAEVTVESHPNTVGGRRFKEYRDAGVNRISLGIQSFQDENLKAIGRNHTADRNKRVLSAALSTGFDAVAIDLMYRLPNQTIENLLTDLDNIKKFQPQGLSLYSLGIEGTALQGKLPELATDAVDKQFFYLIRDLLSEGRYKPFMQPDFSLSGKECKYVVNAWRAPQQLMLSFGAGAQTHYFAGHNWSNIYPVREYINVVKQGLSPIATAAKVTDDELMAKYMVLGVRAINVDKEKFKNMFGVEISQVFNKQISQLIELGWIIDKDNQYQLTREGIYYVDNISKYFYTDRNRGQSQPRGKNLYNFIPDNFYAKQEDR